MKTAYCLAILILSTATVGCDVTFNMHGTEPQAAPLIVASRATAAASGSAPSPEPRPAWVDEPPGLHGGDYETKLLVGPESDRAACEAKLPRLVEGVVADYVGREYGLATPAQFDLRYSTLRPRIVAATWEEKVTTDDEPSTFLHVQLRFDDKLRSEWKHTAERWTTTARTYVLLKGLALGMATVLVVHLALRFGVRQRAAT